MKNRKKIKLYIVSFFVMMLLLLSLFANQIVPYDPDLQNYDIALNAPSFDHWFGTDRFGRDMFSRVIVGARLSIFSTLILVMIISVVGTFLGMICGFFRGKMDAFIMRMSDVFLSFPGLVFAIAVAAVLNKGITNAIIALALISWPKYARLARSQTLTVTQKDFISASKLLGLSSFQIIRKHILPNILGPVLITAILDIGTMMIEIAGLSFLGLGAQPPTPEWASMMSGGRSMLQTYPWIVLFPGLAIFITVVIFNLFGDVLRDTVASSES